MARRRRSNRRTVEHQRDRFQIASHRLPDVVYRSPARELDLRVFEDRRSFDPLSYVRPARGINNRAASTVVEVSPHVISDSVRAGNLPGAARSVGSQRARSFSRGVFRFAIPNKVAVCVRRKRRREVLHALKRTRKGAGARKRRNYWSDVSC